VIVSGDGKSAHVANSVRTGRENGSPALQGTKMDGRFKLYKQNQRLHHHTRSNREDTGRLLEGVRHLTTTTDTLDVLT